jgi:hypothetical protein
MTNIVNVTVAADVSPADPSNVHAEGNVVAVPSGVMWPDTNNVPIVPMVVHGTLGDGLNGATAGECIIQLVASDNFAAGVLNWDIIINIRGLPTVNVASVPVNFASGANQSVWSILSAAGWSPVSQP